MAVIVLSEPHEDGLPVSGGMMRGICEHAGTLSIDAHFLQRLSDAAEYGFIDLYECTFDEVEVFAAGIDGLERETSQHSDTSPLLLQRLCSNAAAIREWNLRRKK
ncbi:hypothetical protein [Deinococcus sp.]|uniref:hypothetical protein n=1 Tax=Deinococcus sp. TaxID=47478 RepID=UPI003CC53DF4